MTEAGLVLEGGATRGVFTSGALDYLMEKDLYFVRTYAKNQMFTGKHVYRQVPVMQSIMSQSRSAGQGTV